MEEHAHLSVMRTKRLLPVFGLVTETLVPHLSHAWAALTTASRYVVPHASGLPLYQPSYTVAVMLSALAGLGR